MFLARKVTRSKWSKLAGFDEGEIPADAISELRTTDNALSTWSCADEEDLESAVLALASGSTRLDKLDLVWFEREHLEERKITLTVTDGKTPISDLVGRHVDVDHLDFVRLGVVARLIHDAIDAGRCKRFRKLTVANLIVRAVADNRVALDSLQGSLKREVEAKMAG